MSDPLGSTSVSEAFSPVQCEPRRWCSGAGCESRVVRGMGGSLREKWVGSCSFPANSPLTRNLNELERHQSSLALWRRGSTSCRLLHNATPCCTTGSLRLINALCGRACSWLSLGEYGPRADTRGSIAIPHNSMTNFPRCQKLGSCVRETFVLVFNPFLRVFVITL